MNFILKKILKCYNDNLKYFKVCTKNTVEIENLKIKIKELEEKIDENNFTKNKEKVNIT